MHVTIEKARSAIFGAAIGDAVGVPYEFRTPGELKHAPVTGMGGNGTFHMPPGTWSDDTSMILGTLDRLDTSLNYDAIMRAFLAWENEGHYTPFGKCFDIGFTTRAALLNYSRTHDVLTCGLDDEFSSSNGSLMRIIPAALYADAHGLSPKDAIALAHALSKITHAHMRACIGCGIYTCVALALLQKPDKSSVYEGLATAAGLYSQEEYADQVKVYARLLSPGFEKLPEEKIDSDGYIVATLECAIWCLLNTGNYRECVLKAANFGNDTDTAACVAGGLAGLLYGIRSIPEAWRSTLVKGDYIEAVIAGFCKRNNIPA